MRVSGIAKPRPLNKSSSCPQASLPSITCHAPLDSAASTFQAVFHAIAIKTVVGSPHDSGSGYGGPHHKANKAAPQTCEGRKCR